MTEAPISTDAAALQKQLTERMVNAYDQDGALKVRIRNDDAGPAAQSLGPKAKGK